MNRFFNVLVLFIETVTVLCAQSPTPNDWYYGSPGEGFNGISMRKAYAEFLKGKQTKTVIVAVIDSGIDVEHEDLKENIWVNPGEIPDNGIDDDQNGYVDDINGWNFIGGPDGKNVGPDSYEATRDYGSLKYKYDNAVEAKLNKKQKAEYETFKKAKDTVEKEIEKAKGALSKLDAVEQKVMGSLDALGTALANRPLSLSNLDSAPVDGLPGAVMDPLLVDRLGLKIGQTFRLGTQEFRLAARLLREPDIASAGFALGPRTIVSTTALANSGLLTPGSLYETRYRMALPAGSDLDGLEAAAEAAFPDGGLRWNDSRNAAPGIERFVERIGSFLVLVGLAGLATGGVGISAAIRAWLARKTETIATLKTLGAGGGLIFRIYLIQVAILAGVGLVIGLVLGAGLPVLAAPLIEAALPFPAVIGFSLRALLEAAFYGAVSALLFTLLPLARTETIRPAALYRGGEGTRGWPRARWMILMLVLALVLIGTATALSGMPELALGTAGGVIGALLLLGLSAFGLRLAARRLARSRLVRGRVGLRVGAGGDWRATVRRCSRGYRSVSS